MGAEVTSVGDRPGAKAAQRSANPPPAPPAQTPAETLAAAIQAYGQAIEDIPRQKTDAHESLILDALSRRDEIADLLARRPPIIRELQRELQRSDELLQGRACQIDALVGSSVLIAWRETFQPRANVWWWSLDKRAAEDDQRRYAVWVVGTGFVVTLSLSFAASISSRFLSGGPDQFGIISTAAQLFLAILAGSTFTQAGRQWLGNIFTSFNIDRRWQYQGAFMLALAVLLLILAFRYSLPTIAAHYNEGGVAHLKRQQPAKALESFQRAVALNPEYAEAHYNLANVYESLLDYDKAMGEYRRVIEINPGFAAAYNNQARLYMQQRGDFARALDALGKLFSLSLTTDEIKYAAHKNRGWALLGLEHLSLAEEDLKEALKYYDGAEAHYLLAQTLEKQGRKDEALEHYVDCEQRAREGDPIEERWLAQALTRIREGVK